MKKAISLIMALMLIVCLGATAFAATGDIVLTYDLSVDGKNEIVVEPGDIITVSYKLSASEDASAIVTQNEIYYDHTFFEIVEGSNKPSAGFSDYTTTLQERLSGKRYVYFNTMTTHTYTTAPAEIGTFQLKVIAQEGESTIANVNCLATDKTSAEYGVQKSDLHVSIGTPQPQQFTVTFLGEDNTVYKQETVDSGESITLPAGPDRDGYTFAYWSIGGETTHYQTGDSYTPSSDVTFTANWTMNPPETDDKPDVQPGKDPDKDDNTNDPTVITYTLFFETNGGSTIESIRKAEGTIIDLSRYTPTKSSYNFAGWYLDAALTQKVTSVELTGNMTVYAKWTEASSPAWDNPFVDVPDDAYYKDAVQWATETGVTSGKTATTFNPDDICTRAEAVTFLWRAMGSPEPETEEMPFKDVKASAYYYDAVLWATENGITAGTSATTFSPDLTVTRCQVVSFLWRLDGSVPATGTCPFVDVKEDAYYYDAVLWAVNEEITSGITLTTFGPDLGCTRAQIITFIWRYLAD